MLHTTLQNALPKSQSPANEDTLSSLADELISHFSTGKPWTAAPGAVNLLQALKKRPEPPVLGVLSNFDPRLHEILQLTLLKPYLDFVLTSHEQQCGKPNVQFFRKAEKTSGLENLVGSHCLHIGNNYELDYVGATNAGWNAVFIKQGGQKKEEHILTFDSLSALHSYLAEQGE